MTVDEFIVWDSDDETGRRWQLVDGEPVLMAPAADLHSRIHAEFVRLLGNHLLALASRCSVCVAPGIVPAVRSNVNFRVPDLGVTCAPPSGGVMVPEPVVLIEILSPGNEAMTRSNIETYKTIASVREILAVQSKRIEIELLQRDDSGNWPASPLILRAAGRLELASIGFACAVAEPYRTSGLAA